MTSQKTIKFEFEVDADTRQVDRFRDALKRIDEASAVSERTLGELRRELQLFSQVTIKTENSLQGQAAALRDASRNADLTGKEYGRLRAEIRALNAEYERLTALESDSLKGQSSTLRSENALQERISYLKQEAANIDVTTKAYADLRLQIAALEKQYTSLTNFGAKTIGAPVVAGNGGLLGQATVIGSSAEYQQRIAYLQKQAANVALNSKEYGTLQDRIRSLTQEYKRLQDVESNSLRGQSTVLGSSNAFQQRIAHLREQAAAVNMTDKAYENLRAELAAVEAQYRKLSGVEDRTNGGPGSRRQRRREFGEVAQQIGIGAFFGGPEGLAGATIGGLLGGPAGAMIGTTVGTGAQQIRMQAAMVGTLVAQLNLAKTSLAQVSKNQEDYNQRLAFARQVSSEYALGLESTISGFAKVSAAATANGLTIQQTESIYRGITSAAVAFGGSQDDIQSAVIATVQVLSKGKVSAEELSGQIGERIPGAVAKFAAANGLSLKQLAKDLEGGKVNISQFVKFLEKQTTDYDQLAKNIGQSTAKAGDRLNLELTRSAEIYGKFFQSVGAGFQDAATALLKWVNNNEAAFIKVLAQTRLFVNDFKFEIKVLADALDKLIPREPFLLLRAGRAIIEGSTGQAPEQEGNIRGGRRANSASRSAGAGEFSISPAMLAEQEYERRLQREIAKLSGGMKPPGFNRGNSAVPGGDEVGGDGLTDKQRQAAADKQQRLIEELAAVERRQAELLANNKINLAERVYERERNLIVKKYELEKQLFEARQNAEEAWLTGIQRDVIGQVNALIGRIGERQNQITQQSDAVERAKKAQGFEVQRASVQATYSDAGPSLVGSMVGGGGVSGSPFKLSSKGQALVNAANKLGVSPLDLATIIGFETGGSYSPSQRGGAGGNYMGLIQFGAPERRAYGVKPGQSFEEQVQGPVVRFLQDRFRGVGMSTQGASLLDLYTTVLAGNPKASRTGRDSFGTSPSSGVAKMGPHRQEAMRRFFGGVPASALARPQPGVTAGQNRGIVNMGQAEVAGVAVGEEQGILEMMKEKLPELNAQDILATTGQITAQIRQQSEALMEQQQELQLRNRLLMEGVRPEIIEQEVELNKLNNESAKANVALGEKLKQVGERFGENSETYRGVSRVITELNGDFNELIANQIALNEAANAPGAKIRARIGGLKQEINALTDEENRILSFADTIESSLGNAISGAVTSVSFGAGSIREVVLGMLRDISNAVVQSISQILAKQGAQSFLSLFGFNGPSSGIAGIGSAGAGLGAAAFGSTAFNNITQLAFGGGSFFADGGIMTAGGPLPLRTYSRGGIADSPQVSIFGEGRRPEAYVPLPDGRRIPVAMQGGGGGVVNYVSVSVDASGNQNVSGNSDVANQLGKLAAAAVQAEFAKQARPGGILAKANR